MEEFSPVKNWSLHANSFLCRRFFDRFSVFQHSWEGRKVQFRTLTVLFLRCAGRNSIFFLILQGEFFFWGNLLLILDVRKVYHKSGSDFFCLLLNLWCRRKQRTSRGTRPDSNLNPKELFDSLHKFATFLLLFPRANFKSCTLIAFLGNARNKGLFCTQPYSNHVSNQ